MIDPGLGFGKRKEQNSLIIGGSAQLDGLDLPIWWGLRAKHFLTHADPEETKFATAAAVTACVLGGAHIVRVHDVREMRAAADVADEIAAGANSLKSGTNAVTFRLKERYETTLSVLCCWSLRLSYRSRSRLADYALILEDPPVAQRVTRRG